MYASSYLDRSSILYSNYKICREVHIFIATLAMTSIQTLFKLLIHDINLPTINAPYQGHTTILTAAFTDILNNKCTKL